MMTMLEPSPSNETQLHRFEQEELTPHAGSPPRTGPCPSVPGERGRGDQVDGPAKGGGEFVGELLDLPAEPVAGLQLVKHVDVAVGRGGPARDGSEDKEPTDPLTGADIGETRLVDRDSGKRRHVVKASDRSVPGRCNGGGERATIRAAQSVERVVGRRADARETR